MGRSLIYLDSNVVIDTIEGRDNELMALLFRSLYCGTYCYPFSAELIGEVTDLEREERNQSRLMYIGDIRKNVYFENSFTSIGFRYENPEEVFKTINDVDIGIDYKKTFANIISFEQISELRTAYKLDPNVLNNMDPKDALACIDSKIENYQYEVQVGAPSPPRSMRDMISTVSAICEESFKGVGKGLGVKAEHDASRKNLVMFFSLLDSFGYWGDPKSKYKKGSRMVDAQHALVGSYFNAIVSRDSHYVRKAEAAYEYWGIATKAYTTNEFKQHLQTLLSRSS